VSIWGSILWGEGMDEDERWMGEGGEVLGYGWDPGRICWRRVRGARVNRV
jgi:hypothetical protein